MSVRPSPGRSHRLTLVGLLRPGEGRRLFFRDQSQRRQRRMILFQDLSANLPESHWRFPPKQPASAEPQHAKGLQSKVSSRRSPTRRQRSIQSQAAQSRNAEPAKSMSPAKSPNRIWFVSSADCRPSPGPHPQPPVHCPQLPVHPPQIGWRRGTVDCGLSPGLFLPLPAVGRLKIIPASDPSPTGIFPTARDVA